MRWLLIMSYSKEKVDSSEIKQALLSVSTENRKRFHKDVVEKNKLVTGRVLLPNKLKDKLKLLIFTNYHINNYNSDDYSVSSISYINKNDSLSFDKVNNSLLVEDIDNRSALLAKIFSYRLKFIFAKDKKTSKNIDLHNSETYDVVDVDNFSDAINSLDSNLLHNLCYCWIAFAGISFVYDFKNDILKYGKIIDNQFCENDLVGFYKNFDKKYFNIVNYEYKNIKRINFKKLSLYSISEYVFHNRNVTGAFSRSQESQDYFLSKPSPKNFSFDFINSIRYFLTLKQENLFDVKLIKEKNYSDNNDCNNNSVSVINYLDELLHHFVFPDWLNNYLSNITFVDNSGSDATSMINKINFHYVKKQFFFMLNELHNFVTYNKIGKFEFLDKFLFSMNKSYYFNSTKYKNNVVPFNHNHRFLTLFFKTNGNFEKFSVICDLYNQEGTKHLLPFLKYKNILEINQNSLGYEENKHLFDSKKQFHHLNKRKSFQFLNFLVDKHHSLHKVNDKNDFIQTDFNMIGTSKIELYEMYGLEDGQVDPFKQLFDTNYKFPFMLEKCFTLLNEKADKNKYRYPVIYVAYYLECLFEFFSRIGKNKKFPSVEPLVLENMIYKEIVKEFDNHHKNINWKTNIANFLAREHSLNDVKISTDFIYKVSSFNVDEVKTDLQKFGFSFTIPDDCKDFHEYLSQNTDKLFEFKKCLIKRMRSNEEIGEFNDELLADDLANFYCLPRSFSINKHTTLKSFRDLHDDFSDFQYLIDQAELFSRKEAFFDFDINETIDDVHVKQLNYVSDVMNEKRQMQHCIFSYTESMIRQKYIAFHLVDNHQEYKHIDDDLKNYTLGCYIFKNRAGDLSLEFSEIQQKKNGWDKIYEKENKLLEENHDLLKRHKYRIEKAKNHVMEKANNLLHQIVIKKESENS